MALAGPANHPWRQRRTPPTKGVSRFANSIPGRMLVANLNGVRPRGEGSQDGPDDEDQRRERFAVAVVRQAQ